MYYSAINNQRIATLTPTVQAKAKAWLAECEAQGVWVLITSAYRPVWQQNLLYAQGRWLPGKVVTNAKGNLSMHCHRIAIDFVPADAQGNLHWDDWNRITQAADIGKRFGANWGGDWPGFKDNFHLEWLVGHPESYFVSGGTV